MPGGYLANRNRIPIRPNPNMTMRSKTDPCSANVPMQHRIKTAGIRVVGIDERALAGHCQWPGPRHRLAKIVETLRDLGAAVIVFDVLFAEPDRMSPSNLIADPATSGGLKARRTRKCA